MLRFIGMVFVLVLSACDSISIGVGSQDAGVDSGVPVTDSGSLDAGSEDASVACYISQDVYVEPGEDPMAGQEGVLSCSYTELPPPVIMGKPTNLVTYRCIMPCYNGPME